MRILDFLLTNYNDGRKKTFFCLAVNLLDRGDLRTILAEIGQYPKIPNLTLKEKSALATKRIKEVADVKDVDLSLRKMNAK